MTGALFASYSGVLSVLLPRQVAALDPDDKVAALAVVTSISFAVTAFAQPLVGALSDRTRSRWGRRVPWMVAGALVGGAALGAAAGASSIAALAVAWAVGQFALNGTDVASTAFLVDRFEPRRRGGVAAVIGVAAIAGGAVGAVLAGRFTASPAVGYGMLAGAVLVAVLIFAVLVRDPTPAVRMPRQGLGAFLRRFWVDPRRHPDFARVLAWRLCFTLGYGAVYGYLLYLLTDFVGVGPRRAAELVGAITVIGGACVVVAIVAGGWLSDRIGRRTPFLIVAGALVVVGDVVPLLVPSVGGVMVLTVALALALGLSIVCGTALASEVLPDPGEGAARGLGTLNLATSAGQALAPIAAAAAITLSGGYEWLFAVSIAAVLVATALIATVRRSR